MAFYKSFDPLQQKQNLCRGSSDIISSDERGQVKVTKFKISDSQMTDLTNVIRTAAGIDTAIANKMDLVNPAVAGNLVKLDSDGQCIDSGFKVDDASAPSASVLYTSQKVNTGMSTKADKVLPGVVGDLASIDALGQYQDSGFLINDAASPSINVLYTSARPKIFMKVSLNSDALPQASGIPLTGVAGVDPFSMWNGTKAVVARDGYYSITATVRVGPTAQAVADRWIQLEAFADSRFLCCSRFITGSSIAGVGDNDSIFLQISTVSQLMQGELVGLFITNAIGLPKSVIPNMSQFKMMEL
jgi:hypothetical protein